MAQLSPQNFNAQTFEWPNYTAQNGAGQLLFRRQNTNKQSNINQSGWGNYNAQIGRGQFLDHRQNFNGQAPVIEGLHSNQRQNSVEQIGYGNVNVQDIVSQKDLNLN